jgi:glycosyltransferase involved in cell wall biosynthesis
MTPGVPAPPDLRVAVVIPALNEGASIGEVVRGTRRFVPTVLVVDDGSSDGTGARANEARAEVVTHPANLGKGTAIRTGLSIVLERGYTHVLLMDGDGQHVAADVPALLAVASRPDVDVVIGERSFDRARMPRARYYSNVLGSRVLSWLIGRRVRDSQCGFRVLRCAPLRDMTLTSIGYEIETELLIKLARRGARFAGVPITLTYDGHVSKLRPVRDTTRTCLLALYYRFVARG